MKEIKEMVGIVLAVIGFGLMSGLFVGLLIRTADFTVNF